MRDAHRGDANQAGMLLPQLDMSPRGNRHLRMLQEGAGHQVSTEGAPGG